MQGLRGGQRRPVLYPFKPYMSIILVGGLFILPHQAHAVGIADAIAAPYRASSQIIAVHFLGFARALFWKLAAIECLLMAILLIFQKGDIQSWAAHIIRQILSLGFYSYLMEHGYEFSLDIIHGLRSIGDDDGRLEPQNIFAIGYVISAHILQHVTLTDLTLCLVQGLSALIICIGFAFIAALIIAALCEGYVLIGIGVLLTGFGGLSWTRDFAHRCLSLSMGIGAKLLTFYMLTQIGYLEMRRWTDCHFETSHQCLEIVGGTIIYLLLMLRLPQLAQQAIHGSIIGSTALEGISRFLHYGEQGAGAALGASSAIAAGTQYAASHARTDPQQSPGAADTAGKDTKDLGKKAKNSVLYATRTTFGASRAAAKGVGDEIYGRLTGSKLRSGTSGGRIGHYIRQRQNRPQQPTSDDPHTHKHTETPSNPD